MIEKATLHADDEAFHVSAAPQDTTAAELARMDLVADEEGEDDIEAEEAMRSMEQTVKEVASTSATIEEPVKKELHSFEVDPTQARDSTSFFRS